MRLLLDKHNQLNAEHVCHTVRDGQRVLKECAVEALYIGSRLRGRGSPMDVLIWAKQHGKLPGQITLVSNDMQFRHELEKFLKSNGYSGDGIFFYKSRLH